MFDRPGVPRNRVLRQENASTEQAPAQTVTHMAPIQMFAVQYGDATGKAHNTVVFKIGDAWYMDSKDNRGEKWAKELSVTSGWLSKQLTDVLRSSVAPLPTQLDPIGVLGDG